MAMAQPPGGRRQYSDETRRIALIFMAILVLVFFALVIRMYFDRKAGYDYPLKPVRGARGLMKQITEK